MENVPAISLRRETDDDLEFLKALYAASREREMELLVDWNDEQKRDFLNQQFNAQRSHYREHYPEASFDVIERKGQPIGRLYVAQLDSEIRLMDISLMPAVRNAGIGGRFCVEIMSRATQLGKIVSLHVEENNPAIHLYERLGFVEVGEVGFYKLLHWCPQGLGDVSVELSAQLNMAS